MRDYTQAFHFLDFARNDFFDALWRDWFDVSMISELWIGHDRRRIRIDQDDPITFLLERFASLRARIIEFAGLPNDDRAGADDED